MKTSDKIISTILILAILIGGGYFAAKHFGLIGGASTAIEEPQDIETVEVWNDDWYQTDMDGEYLDKVEAMKESPATYFIGEGDVDNWYLLTMSQTNKETFDSTVTKVPTNKVINCTEELLKDALNKDFSCTNERQKEERLNDELWYMADAETLIDNNVKIKCDSVKIEKIGAWDCSIPYNPVEFLVIATAEVTTVSADSDISNTPFGNEGETVTVSIAASGWIQQYNGYTARFTDYTSFERIN